MLLFNKRLKEIRKKVGLTQEELGNLVGVTKVSVCCYEKGTRTPTLETLLDIADALHVDFSYLLGTESYTIAEDDSGYGMNIARDECELIKELRHHPELYDFLVGEPDRALKIIEQKMF